MEKNKNERLYEAHLWLSKITGRGGVALLLLAIILSLFGQHKAAAYFAGVASACGVVAVFQGWCARGYAKKLP